jgi:hypothetical protein
MMRIPPAACQLFAKDTFTGGADLRRMLWRDIKIKWKHAPAAAEVGKMDGVFA